MMNEREVKIRNLKVQRMREEHLLHEMDYPPSQRKTQPVSPPKIDPARREFKRPCQGVKFRNRTKAAIPTSFPQRNTLREYLRGERT